jgi:hypothetical protein
MNTDTKKPGFMSRHRTAIMVLSLVLFLPPLAFIFQVTTGDGDFCGTWCPRMFYAIRKGAGIGEIVGGVMRAIMGVALVVAAIASTFFLGRYWCSHLCPVGGAVSWGASLFRTSSR